MDFSLNQSCKGNVKKKDHKTSEVKVQEDDNSKFYLNVNSYEGGIDFRASILKVNCEATKLHSM